mmetsp:Transcript_12510/g.41015  ORF Transcript_12510/g.41015 Transcript_12510/m.41015 type:complete len:263 (-) Transcript_12510:1045-1833(-)|eukprot:scaffold26875_cov101-Isochrysis_galbana.AAC.1
MPSGGRGAGVVGSGIAAASAAGGGDVAAAGLGSGGTIGPAPPAPDARDGATWREGWWKGSASDAPHRGGLSKLERLRSAACRSASARRECWRRLHSSTDRQLMSTARQQRAKTPNTMMTTSSQKAMPQTVLGDGTRPSLGVVGSFGAAAGGLGAARMRNSNVQHTMPTADPTKDPMSAAKESVEMRAVTSSTVKLVCAVSNSTVTKATDSASPTRMNATSTSVARGMSCSVALRTETGSSASRLPLERRRADGRSKALKRTA